MSIGVSGIVLAAGTSSRLGGAAPEGSRRSNVPKQLLELGCRTLLRRVAEAALGSRLAEVVVVLGHASERVAGAVAGLEVKSFVNSDYPQGQSTSVRCGLARVARGARGALFLPADQPLVSSRLIDRLLDAYDSSRARLRRDAPGPIVVPVSAGRRGAPVLFDRTFFAELKRLEGDAGGRLLLPRHRQRIVEVAVEDPLELEDVDTEADLRRLEAALAAQSSVARR